jgi:hypothetical protein
MGWPGHDNNLTVAELATSHSYCLMRKNTKLISLWSAPELPEAGMYVFESLSEKCTLVSAISTKIKDADGEVSYKCSLLALSSPSWLIWHVGRTVVCWSPLRAFRPFEIAFCIVLLHLHTITRSSILIDYSRTTLVNSSALFQAS